MVIPPKPDNEEERLAELKSYDILDTEAEEAFDELTKLVSQILGTPMAMVSLLDRDRLWFKSTHGLPLKEAPRDITFCAHAILDPGAVYNIPDASKDERFCDNPFVSGEAHVRFYIGAPLVTQKGLPIGTLCAIDSIPRDIEPEKVEALRILAKQTMAQIELRAANRDLVRQNQSLFVLKKELEAFHKRVSRDLETAQEIQSSLMGVDSKNIDNYEIVARYFPTDEVSGDAVGFFQDPNKKYFDIFFADVSGHGITSALISAMSLMAFEVSATETTPDSALNKIHDIMYHMHENHYFISACYLRFLTERKVLQYSYGGHHEILVVRGSQIFELTGIGSFLLTPLPQQRDTQEFALESGDKVIVVSDGFFDVYNSEREQLGWNRLVGWIAKLSLSHPNEIGDQLVQKVKSFSSARHSDDMTYLEVSIP